MVDYLAPTTANGSWGVYPFSHPLDNDNTGNTFRVNNTVKYAAPDFAGFSFGGTYSFSNDTGFANNRQWSVGAQYEQGGLLVGAAFLNADNPGATSGGAIAGVGRRRCELCVGAAADFRCGHQLHGGAATVGFAYTNSNVTRPTANVGYLFGDETIEPVTGPLAGHGVVDQVPELRGERQIPVHAGVVRRGAVRVHDGAL